MAKNTFLSPKSDQICYFQIKKGTDCKVGFSLNSELAAELFVESFEVEQ